MNDVPSQTQTTETPLMNSTEARTETGEIIDQGQLTQTTETTSTETPKATSGAPEAYTDFTAPEGVTLDPALIAEATPIFKELGLSQEGAQRLVDFHNKQMTAVREAGLKAVTDLRNSWVDQVKADKDIGPKLDQVKVEIGRAKDRLSPEVRAAFNEALDFTGAGDHPAVVKAFYEFAKLVNEGTHVAGRGPSPDGQSRDGKVSRPSLAGAMYPNLPQ